ncbi:cytochrome C oxidase [Nesidiocoris tenuis]|uniref:Cytochrome c oxidase subunit 5A, mitochondrial n=1 Tax=Nesidiocoris tenuis TaxID=355587 RepID=A0ABN7AQJ9_9HEMI|nr:cytochrome C oxidase [Nesidiocoris tenuis]
MALRRLSALASQIKRRSLALPMRYAHRLPPSPLTSDDNENDFICKYEAYFNRGEIDGWEVRRALDQLHGMDLVPDPRIINAALKACRRINDYALAVRCLESVRFKCADNLDKFWPYIYQEIQPTLEELGVETPEQLGYHKPELALKSVYDM